VKKNSLEVNSLIKIPINFHTEILNYSHICISRYFMKIAAFLSESPVFAIYQAQEMLDAFQKQLEGYNVHFLQALILTALFFEDREVRPKEFQKEFGVTNSSLSHALRDLERKALVKRALHSSDARGYLFSLTPLGRKRAQALINVFDRVQSGLEKLTKVRSFRAFVAEIQSIVESYGKLQ
jgi:DNA-binding MarR family transcriptional regulator